MRRRTQSVPGKRRGTVNVGHVELCVFLALLSSSLDFTLNETGSVGKASVSKNVIGFDQISHSTSITVVVRRRMGSGRESGQWTSYGKALKQGHCRQEEMTLTECGGGMCRKERQGERARGGSGITWLWFEKPSDCCCTEPRDSA